MLSILTINVNGLRKRRMRWIIFNELKKMKIDICFLQETHILDSDIHEWNKEWDGEIIYQPGTSHSRGEIILLSSKFDYENLTTFCRDDRMIGISFKHLNTKVHCINIYAPNKSYDKTTFYTQLKSVITNHDINPDDYLIIGGDFNCVIDNKIDIISGETHANRDVMNFNTLVEDCSLTDSWRQFHNIEKHFTFKRIINSITIARRLDYIFLNDSAIADCISSEIIDLPYTDHRGVLINIQNDQIKHGRGYWKMNDSLLSDQTYVDGVNKIVHGTYSENVGNLSIHTIWDLCKFKIKSFSMEYGKYKAETHDIEEKHIQYKLEILNSKLAKSPQDPTINQTIEQLKIQLDKINTDIYKGAQIRSKAIWAEYGEKGSKYFLNLEKYRAKQKIMTSMKLPDGTETSNQEHIMEGQVKFYEKLYGRNIAYSQNSVKQFLRGVKIPQLNADQKQLCDEVLQIDECKTALKSMKNNSSPGIDGLTTSWYKVFWTKIEHIVMACYNESFKTGKLSNQQRSGVLTLLHKGKQLPRNEIGNWRPISITNTDYKIITKALANRLKQVIGHIICEDQNGYIKGRHSGIVIRAIDDVIEYADQNNMSGAIMALDYSKAFDSLSKDFMTDSLKLFGFGNSFIHWIKTITNDTVSCVSYCGWLSRWIPLKCGIRQGCPISPLLFILSCEILSCRIRQSKCINGIKLPMSICGRNDIKVMQFADDTTLFLSDEPSIYKCLEVVDQFSQFTGLTLNKNKTEAMWIGCWKYRRKQVANISWKSHPDNTIKILGITFQSDRKAIEIEKNWTSKFEKCEKTIKSWLGRRLTIMGRITLVKSFLLSQFMYVMQALILPNHIITRINKLLFKFVWCKKAVYKEKDLQNVSEKVTRATLIKPYAEGGLQMINVEHMQQAIAIKWIAKIICGGNGIWRAIPTYYLNLFGPSYIIFRMNCAYKHLKGITGFFPYHYKNILKIWFSLPHKVRNTDNDNVIWNNKDYTYKGKVIFNKFWINNGIVFHSDIIQNKQLCNFEIVSHKIGQTGVRKFEYNIIKNAISTNMLNRDVSPTKNFNIKLGGKQLHNLQTKEIRNILANDESGNEQMLTHGHVWTRSFDATKEIKLIVLHWKILHNIYPTNLKLYQMKIKLDNICDNCTLAPIDTTEHFFYKCKSIQPLWNQVEKKLNLILDAQIVIQGVTKTLENLESYEKINLIILIGKRSIVLYKINPYRDLISIFEQEL